MAIMYIVVFNGDIYGPFHNKIEGRMFLHRTAGSITAGKVLLVQPPETVANGELKEHK